jgi:hypothetical protein
MSDVQAALRATFPEDPVYRYGLGKIWQILRPERLKGKIAVDESRGGLAHHHRARHGKALNAGRNIGRSPQGEPFLSPCTPHGSDDDEARVDSYPNGQADSGLLLQTAIEWAHGLQNA